MWCSSCWNFYVYPFKVYSFSRPKNKWFANITPVSLIPASCLLRPSYGFCSAWFWNSVSEHYLPSAWTYYAYFDKPIPSPKQVNLFWTCFGFLNDFPGQVNLFWTNFGSLNGFLHRSSRPGWCFNKVSLLYENGGQLYKLVNGLHSFYIKPVQWGHQLAKGVACDITKAL